MRAICLLRETLLVFAAQERGFSNRTGGKEESMLCMRDTLHLLETTTTASKSKKLAGLASLSRPKFVPTKCGSPVSPSSVSLPAEARDEPSDDIPWNVARAAQFLGVSAQTVYLWVERKQIPHLRVMGRNIRFLRADLERFRTTFRREPRQSQDTPT
jgi:excisionase family DNA binding protein